MAGATHRPRLCETGARGPLPDGRPGGVHRLQAGGDPHPGLKRGMRVGEHGQPIRQRGARPSETGEHDGRPHECEQDDPDRTGSRLQPEQAGHRIGGRAMPDGAHPLMPDQPGQPVQRRPGQRRAGGERLGDGHAHGPGHVPDRAYRPVHGSLMGRGQFGGHPVAYRRPADPRAVDDEPVRGGGRAHDRPAGGQGQVAACRVMRLDDVRAIHIYDLGGRDPVHVPGVPGFDDDAVTGPDPAQLGEIRVRGVPRVSAVADPAGHRGARIMARPEILQHVRPDPLLDGRRPGQAESGDVEPADDRRVGGLAVDRRVGVAHDGRLVAGLVRVGDGAAGLQAVEDGLGVQAGTPVHPHGLGAEEKEQQGGGAGDESDDAVGYLHNASKARTT